MKGKCWRYEVTVVVVDVVVVVEEVMAMITKGNGWDLLRYVENFSGC